MLTANTLLPLHTTLYPVIYLDLNRDLLLWRLIENNTMIQHFTNIKTNVPPLVENWIFKSSYLKHIRFTINKRRYSMKNTYKTTKTKQKTNTATLIIARFDSMRTIHT
jgi:hypothetical protein